MAQSKKSRAPTPQDDYFDLPPETQATLAEGMSVEGPSLPWPTPLAFWVNGDAKLKQVGGPSYFGGFRVRQEDLNEVIATSGKTLPAAFRGEAHEVTTENGDTYMAVDSRHVVIAPIGWRFSWVRTRQGGQGVDHFANHVPGARSKMHFLALLGDTSKEAINTTPWGPIVLSFTGTVTSHVLDVIRGWEKETAGARREHAKNLPASLFYFGIGTFSAERQAVMVGPEGSQSPITPPQLAKPKDINADLLRKLYVGKETAEQMAAWKREAMPWLNYWKQLQQGGDIAAAFEEEAEEPF